jgi:hypothetical protein
MHLDLIGPEVQHHGTDFAAEGGAEGGADRHREWGEGHRPQARCRHRGKGRVAAWPDCFSWGDGGQCGEDVLLDYGQQRDIISTQ